MAMKYALKRHVRKSQKKVNQHSAANSNKNNWSLVYYIALLRV